MKLFLESFKKFRYVWMLVLVMVLLGIWANQSHLSKEQIVYSESLDLVVARVEQDEITLRDFAVYVAHQEKEVQKLAEIYDAENTKKYWNLHTDGVYISHAARNEAMSMAIHDMLFYHLLSDFKLAFTEEDMAALNNDVDDFWNDLVEEGKQPLLGISRDDVYNTMFKIAVAEKVQRVYAGILGVDYSDLNYSEEVFLDFLSDYDYEVDDSVLSRLDFGDITLTHE